MSSATSSSTATSGFKSVIAKSNSSISGSTSVCGLLFNKAGTIVVVLGYDTKVNVRDTRTLDVLFELDVNACCHFKAAGAWAQNEKLFVTISQEDFKVVVFAVSSDINKPWEKVGEFASKHTDEADVLVAHPTNPDAVLSAGVDGFCYIHSLSSNAQTLTISVGTPCYSAVFSRDGGKIFVGCQDGNIRAFNANTGSKLFSFKVADHICIIQLRLIKNDQQLLCASFQGLYLHDISAASASVQPKLLSKSAKMSSAMALSVAENEEICAVAGRFNAIKFFHVSDLAKEACQPVLLGKRSSSNRTCHALTFAPKLPQIALGCSLSEVSLYTLDNPVITGCFGWWRRKVVLWIATFTRRRIRLALFQWRPCRITAYFL